MKSIREEKVNKTDFLRLENSLAVGRAEAVFDDMKRLFDLTVTNLKAKAAQERTFIEETYNRIVEDQKKMMIGFEMK